MKPRSLLAVITLFLGALAGLLAIILLLSRLTADNVPEAVAERQRQWAEQGFYQFNPPRQLTTVALLDLQQQPVTFPAPGNHWQLVNFGYLFCPDICPINLRLLADIKTAWDQQHPQYPLTVTHITFDPERDTPADLKTYLAYHHPEFTGLTGELKAIRQVARQLNVTFIHEPPDEYGNYFISHSDSIALLNPQGQFVGLFKGPYRREVIEEVLGAVIIGL